MSIKMRIVVSLFCCLFAGCGLGLSHSQKEIPSAVLRPHNMQAQIIDKQVSQKQFVDSLRNSDMINRLRLIEVVGGEDGAHSEFPEYRLFSILPQSAYALLGFEDGDVLVSANDYALNQPDRFRNYVRVLHLEPGETFAEIRRQGEPLILKWRFSKGE